MRVPRGLVWLTLFGAGVAYEIHEVREASTDTLSEVVRTVAFVDRPVGRVAFLMGWGWFASWFAVHIIGPRSDPRWRDQSWQDA